MAFDFRAKLTARDGFLDEDALETYKEELSERFYASPEGKAFLETDCSDGWTEMLVHYAASYLEATPATLRPVGLEEVVFEIFPRKVSCEPDSAHSIVEELRAFYRFAGRELGLKSAGACLEVLGGDAERRLQRALASPANWGMAKSFFHQGQQAGFDMTTNEGLQKWVAAHNAGLAGGELEFVDDASVFGAGHADEQARQATSAARKAQKQKRKAQKAARKRSR